MSTKEPVKSKRAKYTRPCDRCSGMKQRCTEERPCFRCVKSSLPCTNIRGRKKLGPKPGPVAALVVPRAPIQDQHLASVPLIRLDMILPCLQVYQTWYYSVWPVLSVANLISSLVSVDGRQLLNKESSVSYSLSLAVCAAILKQIQFLSKNSDIISLPQGLEAADYVRESLRCSALYEHKLDPSPDTLLTAFFLFVYYINSKNGTATAILYLREAISIAQVLGLHRALTYAAMSPAHQHRYSKIYYLLLVTERYMCIQDDVPIILDATIPVPLLDAEEYALLLLGFVEIVKVFAIPDRGFFTNLLDSSGSVNMLGFGTNTTRPWIVEVQNKLQTISVDDTTSEIQKVNIILSKTWMRSLAWHLSFRTGLVLDAPELCLSITFPVSLAHDFLRTTTDLPPYAFESNGPGVVVKLLEIADGVADSIESTYMASSYTVLNGLFHLISQFKTDVTLPALLYHKIERMVYSRPVPRPIEEDQTFLVQYYNDFYQQ